MNIGITVYPIYGGSGIVGNTIDGLSATYVGGSAQQADNKLVIVGAGKYSGDSNEAVVAW